MNVEPSRAAVILEVCVDSVSAAVAAERAGADRIELNLALELDGLTPSAGLVGRVLDAVRIPVIAMVRPRAGDFCYSDDEWATMMAEARWLLEQGVTGLAFGCLTESGQIQRDRCAQFRALSSTAELVFHKAFDATCDWALALDGLIEAGMGRVMSSGHADTALAGAARLSDLYQRADGRIEILPAGGIREENAVAVLQQSGCDQIHGSFRTAGGQSADDIGREIVGARRQLAESWGGPSAGSN